MQCQASYWSTEPEEKGADYILMTIGMQIVLNRPPCSLIGAAHATQVTYALGTLVVCKCWIQHVG